MRKTIWVLVGPPAVGKSHWVRQNFTQDQSYIISRDDIVESVALENSLTYDDMFSLPDKGIQLGYLHPQFGTVEISTSNGYKNSNGYVWSKISLLNLKVNQLLRARISGAWGHSNIISDLTNMTRAARRKALVAVSKMPSSYNKVAVKFDFIPYLDDLKRVSNLRSIAALELGRPKTVSTTVIDQMVNNYSPPLLNEGFDSIITVDCGYLVKVI